MKHKHPISSYNKYICLKMDFVMWAILIFLLRPYMVLIMSFANRRDRMGLIELLYTDRFMMSVGAFAGIPAVLLIYAWTKREPKASDFVRNTWARGRRLLTVSAALNGFLVFLPFLLGKVGKISIVDWAQFAISLIIILMLYKHSYIQDCFSEFPESEA